jgi:3-oxoacyl-[acyl-carrier protein] reductase
MGAGRTMNKTLLITGASGDIGKAIANELSNQFTTIYLHYNKNRASVEKLKKELRLKGTNVFLVQANFTEKDGVSNALKQIHEPIDTIIHNSGTSHFGLITDLEDIEVEKFIQLHVTSPFLLTKALLPNMIREKRGKIVIISSIWGLTGAACEVLYSMVKGSQNAFVKGLAKEVARSGISVNAVAPGAINTKMMNDFSEIEREELAEEIPEGRLGKPEEVANVVGFLTSEKSNYINGQVISVNGAWLC